MKCKSLVLVAALLTLTSGCVLYPNGEIGIPSVVVTTPSIEVDTFAPDAYTWDGYEYIGVVGNQYVYLGPGNVWVACEPYRLDRFQYWESNHGDWRNHAFHNNIGHRR